MKKEIFRINCVTPSLIQIEVIDIDEFRKTSSDSISIGTYLKITDDHKASVVALIKSYRIKDPIQPGGVGSADARVFVIDAEPVGFIDSAGKFKRGGQHIAIPPSNVEVANNSLLKSIYEFVDNGKSFTFGSLAQNKTIRVNINGDKFFSKHIAVVGSTGSGKSCTVAKIIQEAVKPTTEQSQKGILNNSHIVIFDLHDEYKRAFPNANFLTIDNLVLPSWLMNAEELEDIFIESNEQNSHNQISQFRQAVCLNKKKYNPTIDKLSYDTPAYFSVKEVFNYISNLNREVIGKLEAENKPKLTNGMLINDRAEKYFDSILDFVQANQSKETKATTGPFHGEFDRFLMRLEAKMNDSRLEFLMNPKFAGKEYKTADRQEIIRQFIGYKVGHESNITVIDLSGIPFEVLSIVVSLISRLLFDVFLGLKKKETSTNEVPLLLVYEEAHNYVPRSDEAKYKVVKKSIERIAKEGRKYGLSLMMVSQRPSEISETIFSQCNNFVAMRLTNPTDQTYVKRLLPDIVSAITENLPALEKREALVIGDSIAIPTILHVDDLTNKPKSIDVEFLTEWEKNWVELEEAL